MASMLVVYGAKTVQTGDISARIAAVLGRRGHHVTVFDIGSLPKRCVPAAFDAVLVGTSGSLETDHRELRSFLREHRATLALRPTAFYQVSLSEPADGTRRRAEAANAVDSLLEDVDWHPDRIGQFGGALSYSKYGFLPRLVLKRSGRTATGSVDTAGESGHPDLTAVDAYAADVGTFLEGRLAGDHSESAVVASQTSSGEQSHN